MGNRTLFDLLKNYFYGCATLAEPPVVVTLTDLNDFQTAFGREMD